MKIYKLLDWTVKKYEGYKDFMVAGQGSLNFDLGTNFEEVKEKFNREVKNTTKQMSVFGTVEVVKRTDREVQIKSIRDYRDEIDIKVLKIVEVEIELPVEEESEYEKLTKLLNSFKDVEITVRQLGCLLDSISKEAYNDFECLYENEENLKEVILSECIDYTLKNNCLGTICFELVKLDESDLLNSKIRL